MKKALLFLVMVAVCLSLAVPLFANGQEEAPAAAAAPALPTAEKPIRLGIVIPGALGDSPPYDSLADGARRFALRDKRIQLVNVYEMGFDQSKWVEQFVAFAASGKYDVVYTSNEALGAMAVAAAKQVPNVKFIVNDCYVAGNDRIFTSFFNKFQQGYLYGFTMALISQSSIKGMNADKKIGLVYGQHYSTLDDLIGGRYTEAVQGEVDDNWDYAKALLSTVPASLDAGASGGLRVTAWQLASAHCLLSFASHVVWLRDGRITHHQAVDKLSETPDLHRYLQEAA